MRLKVPQVTIATAIAFCHRFFLRQSHAKNDRRTIATVCMFLAGKVEETPRPLKDVILISNQMLELYEQNRVAPPPAQGNDTEGSSASVANQRAPGKAPGASEEPSTNENHQRPRQSSMPGHQGYDHPHPEKQNSSQRIPQNEARDGTANSNEGPNMSSTMDAMKKIDKDKVKAALEKRRKSKGDVAKKVDIMDDDDLIERELEHGVELAAEDE
uniref:Cyclin N-terminal domain-containing protein n=1 Tax=Leersia perrieri TaxID=77586 RepID=A0A0D9XP90_9ORYZ